MALENKLGITNSFELAKEEERISKIKALELFDSGRIDEFHAGSLASLFDIHKCLFGEIYDFAGQVRTVNISKGSFRFASAMYLKDALKAVEGLKQSSFDEIIAKYVEMNVVHPFREGNGRAMRIWLDAILKKELGLVIDWSRVDKEDYLLAMERSPIKDTELKELLRPALTSEITDREVFMKGLDNSYNYEGYSAYSASEL